MITTAALATQESTFARAFAAGDVTLARDLYDPAVVYLSPTVRLFGWPQRIEGVERVLEFIQLTIQRCQNIAYRAVELAVIPDADAAFALIHFDWTAGTRRVRSRYVVIYRYRGGRIAQQELYYDPDGALEELQRSC